MGTKPVIPSSVATWLGILIAVLGAIAPQLPADTPAWVSLLISGVLMGLGPALGITSPGIGQRKVK